MIPPVYRIQGEVVIRVSSRESRYCAFDGIRAAGLRPKTCPTEHVNAFASTMRKSVAVHNQRSRVINPCAVNTRWDVRSESKVVNESSGRMRFDTIASKLSDVFEHVGREFLERARHDLQYLYH